MKEHQHGRIWREVTFAIESLGAKELVIEDNRADVILDPLRWRILEILEAGKSVTEISDALDVTDARVLYHVQRLEETGVVRLEGNGAADPRKWRCLPAAGVIRVRAEKAAHSQAVGKQANEAIPADVADQFNQALREAAEGMYGPSSQVSINHNRARLSDSPGRRIQPPPAGPHRGVLPARSRETDRASSTDFTACSRPLICTRLEIRDLRS